MNVHFVGYAADCVVTGEVALEGDRLTDLLTGQEEYSVDAVTLESLDEGRVVEVPTANVLREELCVVSATGPRGDPRRRLRTRPHPMRAQVGPYEVFGYLHATPTADPVTTALRRAVVPMTTGWIRYRRGSEMIERRHDGMLINRDRIDWLEHARDRDALLPSSLEVSSSSM